MRPALGCAFAAARPPGTGLQQKYFPRTNSVL